MPDCLRCGTAAVYLVRAERSFDDDVEAEVQESKCDACGFERSQTWLNGVEGDDFPDDDGGCGEREPRRPNEGPPVVTAQADQ